MPNPLFTDDELTAFLDEMLPVQSMAAVEKSLRKSEALRNRMASLAARRDHGVHSVGEVWRRMRLSCPSRSQLGSYLLDALEEDYRDYIEFHIHTVGCRICAANVKDLEEAMQSAPEAERRRKKFFQSSAGYLNHFEEQT